MKRIYSSFQSTQASAKDLAQNLNKVVIIKRISENEWEISEFSEGKNNKSSRKYNNFTECIDANDDGQYHLEKAEHEEINAKYYSEQRIINEGSHEEYIRYLYGP